MCGSQPVGTLNVRFFLPMSMSRYVCHAIGSRPARDIEYRRARIAALGSPEGVELDN